MLIVGAKGFAKEILETFHQLDQIESIVFYDDVNEDIGDYLYSRFPILNNEAAVNNLFIKNNQFTIGIGNPILRFKLYKKFTGLGGKFVSTISPTAQIGNYEVTIGEGSNVLDNSIFSNSVVIGKGCIVYYNAILTHDCIVGDFVEISPSAILLGRCQVGNFSQIGANATILPDIKIGVNVIIGAGATVTKDIPDNCIAFGSPAKIIRELEPLIF